MANREKTTPAIENALNAAQVLFTANPLFLGPQTKHFWRAQEHVLDEVEKFSSAWFQRRHDATRSMIGAGRRIVSEGRTDPTGAMKEIVEWQTHSMQRFAEDAKDFAGMMTQCAGVFVANEIEAMEQTVENTKKATKSSKSEPV